MIIRLSYDGKAYFYTLESGQKSRVTKTENHKGTLIGKISVDLYNANYREFDFDDKWDFQNTDYAIGLFAKQSFGLSDAEFYSKYMDFSEKARKNF